MPAAITVVNGQTIIQAGENTLAATQQAQLAAASASAAALSEATAESAAGPTYANTAAGIAGTTNGQSFAVDNGDGTVTIYLNSSGTPVAQRTLATTAALGAGNGAARIGTQSSGTGGAIETQEIVNRRRIWGEGYALSSSRTAAQNKTSFDNAIVALGTRGGLLEYRGDYATNIVRFPQKPARITFRGQGALTQGTANTAILAPASGVVRILDASINGPVLIPHASSSKTNSANILADISAFENSTVDVQSEPNAAASGTSGYAYAVVAGHANGVPCYDNDVRVVLSEGPGPKKAVLMHNDGGGAASNPNHNRFRMRCYGISGSDVAVDCADTTLSKLHFSLLEASALTGYRPGSLGVSEFNWYELLKVAADLSGTVDTVPNGVKFRDDMFSGYNTIVIPDTVTSPPQFECSIAGVTFIKSVAADVIGYISGTTLTVTTVNSGAVTTGHAVGNAKPGTTVTGQLTGTTGGVGTYSVSQSQTTGASSDPRNFSLGVATNNYVRPTISIAQPVAGPTFAFILGSGTISGTGEYRHLVDHHGVMTYFFAFTVASPSTGRQALQINPPTAEWEIQEAQVGVEEIGTAVRPVAIGNDAAGRNYVWYNPNTNSYSLSGHVTMRAIQ